MPLSEEELRLLEQMEQALAQEDPKFASTLRGSTLERTARMRTIAAAVAFVAGIVMMMGGAVSEQYWLAIIGFLVMLASATLGLAAWRGRHVPASASHQRGDTPEAAFNFDDNPQRFDVIEGGKTRKSRRSGRSGRTSRNKAPKHGTFMQRMEERWERRRHQGF